MAKPMLAEPKARSGASPRPARPQVVMTPPLRQTAPGCIVIRMNIVRSITTGKNKRKHTSMTTIEMIIRWPAGPGVC